MEKLRNEEKEEKDDEAPKVFYREYTPYEITINPSDDNQFFCRANRDVLVDSYVRNRMAELQDCIEYFLVPEISEPRHVSRHFKLPRIHYHGVFQIKYLSTFLLYGLRKLSLFSDVQINSFRTGYWKRYCLKQYPLLRENPDPIMRLRKIRTKWSWEEVTGSGGTP